MAKGVAMSYLGKVDKGIAAYTGSTLAVLRYYFAVNNGYVLTKLQILLVPFRHRHWERKVAKDKSQPIPPKEDVNAPDLYLPLMGFVTYILAAGLALGTKGRFTPESLATSGSSGLAISVIEICGLKLGFYLLQGARLSILDLLSLSGYKFVGVTLALCAYHFLGANLGWAAKAYTSLSMATFLFKSLSHGVPKLEREGISGALPGLAEGLSSPTATKGERQQNYLLYAFGALQLVWSWYLCRV